MPRTVVLGLGNILLSDEGFGIRLLAELYKKYDFPPHTELVDGGTQGHGLLSFVEDTDNLLILDAVDFNEKAGTLIQKTEEGIPAYLTAHKMSQHQNSFSEILALAKLRGRFPIQTALIGIQPFSLEEGIKLSECVTEKISTAMLMVISQLELWGIHAEHTSDEKHLNKFSYSYPL